MKFFVFTKTREAFGSLICGRCCTKESVPASLQRFMRIPQNTLLIYAYNLQRLLPAEMRV